MEDYYEKIINTYIKYYNYKNNTTYNFFDGVSDENDTNEIMEGFRDLLFEYNESSEDEKQLYKPYEVNLDEFEEIHGLFVGDDLVCICVILFPIIVHLADTVNLDDNTWRIKTRKI